MSGRVVRGAPNDFGYVGLCRDGGWLRKGGEDGIREWRVCLWDQSLHPGRAIGRESSGGTVAGLDQFHVDAEWFEFEGERTGEALDGRFARGVRCGEGIRARVTLDVTLATTPVLRSRKRGSTACVMAIKPKVSVSKTSRAVAEGVASE